MSVYKRGSTIQFALDHAAVDTGVERKSSYSKMDEYGKSEE